MPWQEDHRRRVAALPQDVREAHRHSIRHRDEVTASDRCGCFYCCTRFSPSEISEWVDRDADGVGQTALCPNCGIDSVIGDKSGFTPSEELLTSMRAHWF